MDPLLLIEYEEDLILIYYIIIIDTTEFKYYKIDFNGHMTMHKLYLDMCNGEILSYGIGKPPSASNIMNALNEAIKVTSDCPYHRNFHFDQYWFIRWKHTHADRNFSEYVM